MDAVDGDSGGDVLVVERMHPGILDVGPRHLSHRRRRRDLSNEQQSRERHPLGKGGGEPSAVVAGDRLGSARPISTSRGRNTAEGFSIASPKNSLSAGV